MSSLTVSNIQDPAPEARYLEEDVLKLENISVFYRLPNKRIRSFKEYIIQRLRGKVALRTRRALHDIDMTVQRGEIVGLIGHNGAGKSTLLKVVARVLKPTKGRVWIKGRLAPILGVGAGFHPELTGRENVILNGTILGLSQHEVESRMEDIVAFAELEEFIDQPLRTYSSGMRARLGFAVATDTQPDILIIDEVLSVGDASFREKSAARMAEFREGGTTILLVSHNMQTIADICHRAVWLDHGTLKMKGEAGEVVDTYLESQGLKR